VNHNFAGLVTKSELCVGSVCFLFRGGEVKGWIDRPGPADPQLFRPHKLAKAPILLFGCETKRSFVTPLHGKLLVI
jgi:hypothetical protein